VESCIAQDSHAPPKYKAGLRVRDSNEDSWRLICAPRRNAEIKEPRICHKASQPERFPQDMEAGAQTLEGRTTDVMIRNIDKSSLRKSL